MNDFWVNVYRYCTYFVTVILGIFLFLFEWAKPLFKQPISAIALLSLMISGFIFVSFTLRAMLGLNPV